MSMRNTKRKFKKIPFSGILGNKYLKKKKFVKSSLTCRENWHISNKNWIKWSVQELSKMS